MNYLRTHKEDIAIILFIIAFIAVAVFVLPLCIKGFFLALLWMINNPALALIMSCLFLLGMLIGNLPDRNC